MKFAYPSVIFGILLSVSYSSCSRYGSHGQVVEELTKRFNDPNHKPAEEYNFSDDHKRHMEEIRLSSNPKKYGTPQTLPIRYAYPVNEKEMLEVRKGLKPSAPRPAVQASGDASHRALVEARAGLRSASRNVKPTTSAKSVNEIEQVRSRLRSRAGA